MHVMENSLTAELGLMRRVIDISLPSVVSVFVSQIIRSSSSCASTWELPPASTNDEPHLLLVIQVPLGQ